MVQGFSLDNLGTGICQVTLPLIGKMLIYDIRYDCIQNGIAKELQPLIVYMPSVVIFYQRRLVQEGLLINLDIIWIKAGNPINRQIRLLIFVFQKPYFSI